MEDKERITALEAGQESRCDWHKPLPEIMAEAFAEGKKAGIREVVEFLRDNCFVQNIKETGAWQAKLKEWEKKDGE